MKRTASKVWRHVQGKVESLLWTVPTRKLSVKLSLKTAKVSQKHVKLGKMPQAKRPVT